VETPRGGRRYDHGMGHLGKALAVADKNGHLQKEKHMETQGNGAAGNGVQGGYPNEGT